MDNHHVQIAGSQISCGIGQLYSLTSDPEKILYALANHLYHPARGTPYAAVLWSDTQDSNGEKLFEYLEEKFDRGEEYGSAIEGDFPLRLSWFTNPKTGNDIALYTWVIPHERFKQWYIDERVKKASKL